MKVSFATFVVICAAACGLLLAAQWKFAELWHRETNWWEYDDEPEPPDGRES